MPDNTVEIKIIADASTVSPAFDSAAVAASGFVENVAQATIATGGLIGSTAQAGIQLGLFATQESAVATQLAGPLTSAITNAGSQLDLFALEDANATEQLSLFNAAGAVVAPVMAEVGAAVTQAGAASQTASGMFAELVTWFQKTAAAASEMAAEVVASTLEASESIAHFAERTRVSATGIQSSFSLIGGALASVAIVGILAEGLDKIKETAIETEHLSSATGIEVTKIVELKDAMAAVGAPAEGLQQTLQRLVRGMEMAREGGQRQTEAFRQLGVDTRTWKDELPPVDEVLQQLATHMKDSTNNAQDMAATQLIAGRNVVGLTAFLRSQGDELQANMQKHKAHGDAIEGAIPAAQQLVAVEAHLSEVFKTFSADILPGVIAVMKVLEASFYLLSIPVKSLVDIVLGLGTALYQSLVGLGSAAVDIAQGKFNQAAETVKDHWGNVKSAVSFYMGEIVKDVKEGWDKAEEVGNRKFKGPEIPTGDTNINPNIKDNGALKAQEKALEGELQHQVAMLELKRKGFENEEKLGEISGQQNLDRILAVNAEILATQEDFNTKMAAIAAKDPHGAEHVQEIANQRIAAIDKSLAQEQSIRQHYAEEDLHLSETNDKIQQEMLVNLMEYHAKALKKGDDDFLRSLNRQDEEFLKSAKAQERAVQEQLAGEEKHFAAKEELYRKDVEFQASLGIISAAQREQLLQASLDRQTEYQKQTIQKQIDALDAADTEYVAKHQALLNQLQALDDRAAQQRQQAENQHIQSIANTYKSFIDGVGTSFQNGVMSWVKGTQTFGQAFASMTQQMAISWIGTLLQMGVKWAEHQALKLALNLLGITQQESSEAEAAAAGVAIHGAATAAEIPQAAALAAANTFASIAAIPIIGPEIAPGAAAAAFATVMGFEGLAAFEQGGIVSSDQLAMVHKNEMVLPAPLSKGVQSLIQSGSVGGQGGGDHFHFAPTVQAIDAAGIDSILEKHQRVFIRSIQNWNRTGRLSSN